MKVFASIWHLLNRAQRRQLIVLQLLSVLMALSAVGGIAAILPFFSVLADTNSIQRNAVLLAFYHDLHFASAVSFVTVLGAAFACLVLLANALNLFGMLAINRFALQVSDTLYIRLFQQYLQRDFGFHLRSNSATLASTLLHESGRVSIGILRQGLVLVTNLVTIAFILTSILILNPLVALTAVLGLSITYAAVYASTRRLLLRNGRSQGRHQAKRTQLVSESLGAIREVILLGARDFFVQRFAAYSRSLSRIELTTIAISSTPRNILECAIVFCLVSVALYLRSRSNGVGPWMAQLSFIGLAAYRLMPALQQTFVALVSIRTNRTAFENLAAALQRASSDENHLKGEAGRAWCGRPRRKIRVHEVSFRYAADRAAAISNLSLDIPAGSAIGFVGVNGSGKTTLVDILAGLLIPTSGSVEVDGIMLDRANRASWQSTLAYVPQNVFLLDATLAENIALGVPPELIDRERLDVAVERARLSEVVASLANGYEEVLGDRGCRLSGGQRQRLGIARALYRDSSVLILDEATSALDNAAEQEIVGVLNALRPSRTLLLTAHRFSALRHCDIIHEIRNGKIVRSGSYAEFQRAALA